MRALIFFLCVGLSHAGGDMMNEYKMARKWQKHKSMEACFGEQTMRTCLIKMKKAVEKCTGLDAPELDLPMFNNPYRMVHALLEGGNNVQQMKFMKLMQHNMMQQKSSQQTPTIQLTLGQQGQQQQHGGDFMKMMMMKMMMKHMMKGEMSQDEYSIRKRPGDEDGRYPPARPEDMDYEDMDFNKLFQAFQKGGRGKRATDDLYDLGDRLTEKLQMEQVKFQAQLGNMSCVLEELNIIDKNQDLTVNKMIQDIEKGEWGTFEDKWFKEKMISNCRNCASYAESIPKMVLEECPLGVKWAKIKMYMHCEKMAKYRTCMNYDIKQKLEKSFGNLEELEEATGLAENQLLPLTMKLLQEQMDMFD